MVISVDENPSSTVVEGAASVISVPNEENVRDETALPLLSDLCVKVVLAYCPCFAFSLLPSDLKLKILQLLPGIDVARFGCVSSELRFLCSNNDLWKQKIGEEFTESEYSRWASKSNCSRTTIPKDQR
ncbi:hypothetical protein C5167_013604 [Papaver somniferum]|uniref:F-box domain-containing protein n=1 Tax=Papaver somniferum TaxID=3469 RepID=A0A4Y7J0S8_PAPSO|nr:putative F-box protein At1g23770 [Papaver somniferum]RZC54743.1 hypothetical protein C5167_013604 [Papaver somniferum]